MGNVPHAPESATLTVTIIPVTPVGGVKTRPGSDGGWGVWRRHLRRRCLRLCAMLCEECPTCSASMAIILDYEITNL